jgi:hypothetical protein
MFLSIDLSTLIILNALAYFLAVPAKMPQWYFYVSEGIILFFNLLIIYRLIKSGDWPLLFFFLLITMMIRPFYLFSNMIDDGFIPMMSIAESILLFILTLAIEKTGEKK